MPQHRQCAVQAAASIQAYLDENETTEDIWFDVTMLPYPNNQGQQQPVLFFAVRIAGAALDMPMWSTWVSETLTPDPEILAVQVASALDQMRAGRSQMLANPVVPQANGQRPSGIFIPGQG